MTSLTTVRRDATESLTLVDLAAQLTKMQETKRDYLADTRTVGFTTEGDATYLTIDGQENEMPVGGWKLLDHAHGQFSSHLGVPKRYYDRLRQDAPELLDTNIRHWLIANPERRMYRTLDGHLRAFLSDKYQRRDNYDLMERAILPALQDVDGLTFHVASLTPDRMVFRAILPFLQAEVKTGDVVQAGVQFRNNEVGGGLLEVVPFIWRLICLNGMVSSDHSLKSRHVGKRIEETDTSIYLADTLAADDKAFFLKARDAARAAISEDRFQEIVGKMREAATGERIENPVKASEVMAETFGLVEDEQQSLLAQLAGGADLTRWGAVNALTAMAKAVESFDRQEEIERIGGSLLDIAENDWRRIAVAA